MKKKICTVDIHERWSRYDYDEQLWFQLQKPNLQQKRG